MGCSTCKKSNKKNSKTKKGLDVTHETVTGDEKDNMLESFNGSLIMKLIGFTLIVIGFPLIYLGVIIMLFTQFFLPKKPTKNVIGDSIEWVVTKYAMTKAKREIRRREKEFETHSSYEGDSELSKIEVFQTIENNEEGGDK